MQPNNMRSLERAIDVLEVLEATRTPLRLSEVARRAGLHVSTTQRILQVLEARDRVEQVGSGYHTGVAMLFGAHAYLSTSQVALGAHPVLQELATATGLAASVFVRVGFSRAVVARVEGNRPLRYELPIGQRLPIHLGAGKVLAAHMESAEVAELLERVTPAVRADGGKITARSLGAELTRIRKQGYAVAHDERVVGAASVSAPVLDPIRGCIAAVQVAGQTQDLKDHAIGELSIEVRQAASALLTRLPD